MVIRKTPKSAIVICGEKYYIKAKYSGIPKIIYLMGEVALCFFGKSKDAYIEIEDMIGWYEKELKYTTSTKRISEYKEIIRVMKNGLEKNNKINKENENGKVQLFEISGL